MQPSLSAFRLLRQTGTRLGQDGFVCRRCIQSKVSSPKTTTYKSLRQTPFLQAFRLARPQSIQSAIRHSSTAGSPASNAATPLGELGKTFAASGVKDTVKKTFFPETSSKSVAYWLLGSAASVFGIVVFGGLTRLTESGYVMFYILILPHLTFYSFLFLFTSLHLYMPFRLLLKHSSDAHITA